jgi:hypothetical protein
MLNSSPEESPRDGNKGGRECQLEKNGNIYHRLCYMQVKEGPLGPGEADAHPLKSGRAVDFLLEHAQPSAVGLAAERVPLEFRHHFLLSLHGGVPLLA